MEKDRGGRLGTSEGKTTMFSQKPEKYDPQGSRTRRKGTSGARPRASSAETIPSRKMFLVWRRNFPRSPARVSWSRSSTSSGKTKKKRKKVWSWPRRIGKPVTAMRKTRSRISTNGSSGLRSAASRPPQPRPRRCKKSQKHPGREYSTGTRRGYVCGGGRAARGTASGTMRTIILEQHSVWDDASQTAVVELSYTLCSVVLQQDHNCVLL